MAKVPEPHNQDIILICPIPSNIRVTGHYVEESAREVIKEPILAMGLKRNGEVVFLGTDSRGQIESDENLSTPVSYSVTWEKDCESER
jgi:hypothetical protein